MGRATSTSQTQSTHVEWEAANFPRNGVERLIEKAAETLPHASVMQVGELHGMLWKTHPKMVGRPGRSAEKEKKPCGLKVLDGRNATQQQLVRFTSRLELSSDECVAAQRRAQHTDPLLRSGGRVVTEPNLGLWIILTSNLE